MPSGSAPGCRGYDHGKVRGIGSNGFNWLSAIPQENATARNLHFNTEGVNPKAATNRAFGLQLRCLQEEGPSGNDCKPLTEKVRRFGRVLPMTADATPGGRPQCSLRSLPTSAGVGLFSPRNKPRSKIARASRPPSAGSCAARHSKTGACFDNYRRAADPENYSAPQSLSARLGELSIQGGTGLRPAGPRVPARGRQNFVLLGPAGRETSSKTPNGCERHPSGRETHTRKRNERPADPAGRSLTKQSSNPHNPLAEKSHRPPAALRIRKFLKSSSATKTFAAFSTGKTCRNLATYSAVTLRSASITASNSRN